MTTFRALCIIPALLVTLVACSSDAAPSATTTVETAVRTTPPTFSTIDTTTTVNATTVPPGTVPEGPLQIDVLIGTDDSPTRIERVRLGSPVTINITNPTSADEFHLHGYDIEQRVGAGVTATMNFVANQTGMFEVESHETHGVLFALEVV